MPKKHQNIDSLSYLFDTYKSAHKILYWDPRRSRGYLHVSLNDKLFEISILPGALSAYDRSLTFRIQL